MIAASETTLIKSQRRTPCKNGRQPTARSVFADNPAPIRKSVSVRPVVATRPNAGDTPAIQGTKLRTAEASTKKPINQGTCTHANHGSDSCDGRSTADCGAR